MLCSATSLSMLDALGQLVLPKQEGRGTRAGGGVGRCQAQGGWGAVMNSFEGSWVRGPAQEGAHKGEA